MTKKVILFGDPTSFTILNYQYTPGIEGQQDREYYLQKFKSFLEKVPTEKEFSCE